VDEAIKQFEEGEVREATIDLKKNSKIDLIKKEIINLLINDNYSSPKITEIESEAQAQNDTIVNELLADYFNNWGIDLGNLAQTKKGKEVEELYQQAFEKYQKAISIKPDMHEAFYNWGTYLGNLAQTKKGIEAEELYQQALDKYQKAISIKPDDHEVFNNWGTDLGNLAQTKVGKEAEELYQQAFDKYQKAISIKPDFNEAFNNWGNALGKLAQTKEGIEAEELYQQALEKLNKSIDLDGSSYNLSCLYAQKSDKGNALLYLEKCLVKGEITSQFVMEDEDWANYRSDIDFINLLKKYEK
jgi:tetratricopeptide (TPR) repeat protein